MHTNKFKQNGQVVADRGKIRHTTDLAICDDEFAYKALIVACVVAPRAIATGRTRNKCGFGCIYALTGERVIVGAGADARAATIAAHCRHVIQASQ